MIASHIEFFIGQWQALFEYSISKGIFVRAVSCQTELQKPITPLAKILEERERKCTKGKGRESWRKGYICLYFYLDFNIIHKLHLFTWKHTQEI